MAYVLFTKFIKQNPLNPKWVQCRLAPPSHYA